MPKLYELTLEVQIRKLRNTAIVFFVIGAFLSYSLLSHGHKVWALLLGVVALQAALGSAIMMSDIKRDLRLLREDAKAETAAAHS